MLEDKLIQGKRLKTHSTLCLPPHLPKSHPYGQRMSHGPCRGVHCLLPCLWIDYSHPNDPPKESLMRIGWFLSSEPLQLFMVEEGLNPEVVVHSKSLELLGQREVGKDHIMDLNHNKLVFNKWRPDLLRLPVVQMGSPLQISLELA